MLRPDIINSLEENIGRTLWHKSQWFWGGIHHPRVMEIKTESACRWRSCRRASGSILGLGRPPGKGNGNPLQYSCLGNPMDREEPGGLQSMRSQRLEHDWTTEGTHRTKLKSFCPAKETIDKKDNRGAGREHLETMLSTKDSFPKYTNSSYSLPSKNKQPNQKIGRRSKWTFLQRKHTASQDAHERCSMLLIIKEMHIKTTIKYHFMPVRMIIIKEI